MAMLLGIVFDATSTDVALALKTKIFDSRSFQSLLPALFPQHWSNILLQRPRCTLIIPTITLPMKERY
jgi:hypothetical protein